jgi:outer membrane protein assembly factor BamD (BamD/ComL family)
MLARVAFVAVALAAAGSTAPLQCGHTPEAELREDETPGDALWAMAQKFRDSHDVAAEKATLKYLVERYPASRWVSPARDELAQLFSLPSPDAGG